MRVPFQTLLNQTRKARKVAAHISMASHEPNPYIALYADHRRSSAQVPAPGPSD
jgi:hypothetical protein